MDPAAWRRDHAERRVAGVASAVAHGLAVPVALVRLAFVVLTFVHFLGPIAYVALWMVIPGAPGRPTPFDRLIDAVRAFVDYLAGSVPPPGSNRMPGDPHA